MLYPLSPRGYSAHSLPYFVLSYESIPPYMASSKNTFLCMVTLTCILLDGGHEPGKKYDSYQLWHADVVGSTDEGVDIDNVWADEFSTSITFWERNANLLPTKDCVAIVTGEAAFLPNGSGDSPATELALKIRAG